MDVLLLTRSTTLEPEPIMVEWLEGVPSAFVPFFSRPLNSSYMSLLRLGHRDGLDGVLEAISKSATPEADLVELLLAPDWRKQLAGAVGAVLRPTARLVEAVWSAFDRGSWVSPQHVAVARVIDPEFQARARSRIDRWVHGPPPGDTKSLAALVALARSEPGLRESWAPGELDPPRFELLARFDRDRGDSIALLFHEQIRKRLQDREPA
jgi:hypothetical protein